MTRRLALFLFGTCCFALLLSASAALAHPPSGIDLKWTATKNVLEVEVFHGTRFPAKHYIDKVIVKVNGAVVLDKPYSAQTNKASQIDVYVLGPLPAGTKITVIARCNKDGALERSMIVP